jgi:cytosine/adenosine deaminase-related metal-dependent hydrolase
VSNLFLASGVMPLGRYLEAGLTVGLGSDVAGGPDLSIFSVMRDGFYAQNARSLAADADADEAPAPATGPLDWIRLGSLAGAQALGLGDVTGSLEAGKEADIIAIDPSVIAPLDGQSADDDPVDLASRLVFRAHPAMVRAAWVRGRRLDGPGARA